MELSRRTALAGVATGTIASTAGCLGFIMGDDLEFVASPAGASESALNETGYSEVENTTEEQVETVEFVVERDVKVGYSAIAYGMESPADIDFGYGSLAVLATPNASVLGRSVNPIADMDSRELMAEVASQADSERSMDPSEPKRIETRTMTILGEDREVDVFESTQGIEGPAGPVRTPHHQVRTRG
ncbi:MAG: DUF6517 family protein [Natrialbaceae archaeon]|nr:DUF6517 family protein [Natrialbaceae archaeon]